MSDSETEIGVDGLFSGDLITAEANSYSVQIMISSPAGSSEIGITSEDARVLAAILLREAAKVEATQ